MNKYKEHSKVNENHYSKVTCRYGSLACSRKRSFETVGDAVRFMHNNGYELLLEWYKCDICNLFHTATIK